MRGRIFIFLLQIKPILESEFITRRSNVTIDKNAFTEVDNGWKLLYASSEGHRLVRSGYTLVGKNVRPLIQIERGEVKLHGIIPNRAGQRILSVCQRSSKRKKGKK